MATKSLCSSNDDDDDGNDDGDDDNDVGRPQTCVLTDVGGEKRTELLSLCGKKNAN